MNRQGYVLQTGPGRKSSGNAARKKSPGTGPGDQKLFQDPVRITAYFRKAVPVLIRLFSVCL